MGEVVTDQVTVSVRWLTRRLVEGKTVPGGKAAIETERSRPMAAARGRSELGARDN